MRTVVAPARTPCDTPSTRHWKLRDAAACWLLLMVTGWSLATWHPWAQVRWPAAWLPYPLFCAVVAGLVWATCMSPLASRVPRWLTSAGAVALLLYFFAYDLRQRAAFGQGADNTEALEIGAQALLDLHDPYAFSTHLGNPIGPLAGGLLLALPLYALMKSLFLYTVLTWTGGALLAESASPRAALAVVALVAASPWSRATLPYLNDNGITALWVVVFSAWGYWLARRDKGLLLQLTWTAGFVCALDYRWTMWVIGLPYFMLFVRQLGWRKAVTWLAPVLVGTLTLFAAPVFFPSGGYRERTLATLMNHSESPAGPVASALPLLAVLAVVVVGSLFVRTLAGVWATTSVALGVLLVGMSLLWLPGRSMEEAFYRYHFFWYLGWVLVFGIAALLTPDVRHRPLDPRRLLPARLRVARSEERQASKREGSPAPTLSTSG